jgi:hypothetical protein
MKPWHPWCSRARVVCCLAVSLVAGLVPAFGAGILPETQNRIVIQGQFAQPAPAFFLIFSAQPLRDQNGQWLTSFSEAELAALKSRPDLLAIKVHGKQASRPGQFEYSFGTAADANMPWNDGREFHWKDWEKHSPDIWDNLCVAAGAASGSAVVTDVVVHKGGKALYDTRLKQSYPNRRRIDVSMQPTQLAPQHGRHPVLNLAGRMSQFRRDYYELGDNRILNLAYSDLGQTDKRKYAKRGNNWCSEFSSYIYRQSGIATPDPDRSDVQWKSMRDYFQQNGQVFSMREVATWSDEKKLATIKPGSFVSILIDDSTHSIIFTAWVVERGQPITRYTGISGNNKGMVWSHAPLKLPTADRFRQMTSDQLRDYDQKVYFAVPRTVN